MIGQGSGQGRGQGIGQGRGQGRGQGSGQGHGQGRGQVIGQGSGQGRGQGIGSVRGQGIGQGRGQGREQGRDSGRSQGRDQGTGPGPTRGQSQVHLIDRTQSKKASSTREVPTNVPVDTMPTIPIRATSKKTSTQDTMPKDTAQVVTNDPPAANVAEKPADAPPENYPRQIREVVEEDLYDLASFPLHFSTIASVRHRKELSEFVKHVFGFSSDRCSAGVNISNQNAILMKNAAKDLCTVESTLVPLLDFKPFGPKTAIKVNFEDVIRLMSPGNGEYMSEKFINIFGDMFNLVSGAQSSSQTHPLPGVIFVRMEDIKKLFDLSPCNRNVTTAFISDTDFPQKVHLCITQGLMKTVVGDVLKVYKSLNVSSSLKKIVSVVRCQSCFVSVCIDFSLRTVTTHNPKVQNVDGAILKRKWIAKSTAIAHYFINKSPWVYTKKMYLGSEDMKDESFTPEDVPNMPQYHQLVFSFFHRRSDNIATATPSNLRFPTCDKLPDTALLSIWNCFIYLFEWDGTSGCVDVDLEQRKRQFLLMVLVLRLYMDKSNDASYEFEESFDVQQWLLGTQWSNDLHTLFQNVFVGESEGGGGGVDDYGDEANENNEEKDDDNRRGKEKYEYKPFMQCDGLLHFTSSLSRKMEKQKNHYFAIPLDDIVQGVLEENIEEQGVEPKFPETILALARNHPTDVTANVHWNFHNKTQLIGQFQAEVSDVFDSPDDLDGIEYVLKKKSTIFVSVQAKTSGSKSGKNPPVILCFAAVTTIHDNNNFKFLIVDYIGTSKKDPKGVLSDCDYVSFTGKGLGKLMINLLQCLCYVLSARKQKTTKLLLKSDDEKSSFYTTMGFKLLNSNSHLLKIPSVVNHYERLALSKDLKSYCLDDSVVIQHLKLLFINHVYHPLEDVAFAGGMESFVPEVLTIFDQSNFQKRVKIVPKRDNDDPGSFNIPIGEVVAELFQKHKPPEYGVFSGLYESLIAHLYWSVSVVRRKKQRSRTYSVDDLRNPVGSIYVCCGLCHDHYETPFVLDKHEDDDVNDIKTQVMAVLEYFFDTHYQVSNKAVDQNLACKEMKLTPMKNIRDRELQTIGYHSHLSNVGEGLFEKLLLMFQQVHLDRKKIMEFWDWENYRGSKFARSSKLISNKRRRVETVNAVLGLNESRLRESSYLKHKEKIDGSRRRKTVKDFEALSDDLIFLKHMRTIMYVNKHTMPSGDFVDLKSRVSNPECFNDYEYFYWVGFPGEETVSTGGESESKSGADVEYDSDGNIRQGNVERNLEYDSDGNIRQGNNEGASDGSTDEAYEDEEAIKSRFDSYDRSSFNGLARCLNWKWLKEHMTPPFLRSLKQHENRRFNLPDTVLEKIKEDITNLRVDNINFIYKYTCPTTYEMKFCNAVPKRRLRRNQTTAMENYEIMFQDQVSRDWLFSNAVIMNGCREWYDDVMDPTTTDKVFAIPVAAVATESGSLPEKEAGAPVLKYPQYSQGICGVSAFSSAFHFTFNEKLSHLIFQGKEKYLKSLSKSVTSKKSPALICLSELMFQSAFRLYTVKRMTQIVPWKKLLENPFYSNIMLCIPKSTSMLKDHIIGITNGWIFDGNLVYAIPLNESNLTWCTSHGKTGEVFTGFCEQLEIRLKDPKFVGKTKSGKRKSDKSKSK